MEDLPVPDVSAPNSPMPEAGNDPGDPLAPEIEEEHVNNPPAAFPDQDMEVTAENEVNNDDHDNDSDDLSDVDEAQFDDFDADALALEEREQIAVDDSNVALLGVHKRKRTEAEIEEARKKKKKEKKRDRPKKSRRRREGSENFSGGEEVSGKRSRKRDGEGRSRSKKVPEDIDESTLTPEERRRRALDKLMDDALKNPNQRRKKKADGRSLEDDADTKIEGMRDAMTRAAQADTVARENGQPAMEKLRLLPQVTSLLNNNTMQSQLVDPEHNLLEAVRFFLEPLNDGSLPAYNIQKDLFAALGKLPINKDSLVASGIGKVVYFYTKSKRPEITIKRQADRLMADWLRLVLKRSGDYKNRELANNNATLPVRTTTLNAAQQAARDRAMATPSMSNRARIEGGLGTYTVAPNSTALTGSMGARPMGDSGEATFRKFKMRNQGKGAGR
ncbi:hypothetical protein BLS_006826 [Venturia inaequalis]|uniref:TFIIS N-terminal domain-containing protein n=1 Tax=Venturia inaequalis TaxID=5025 RepID=A0A8H3V3R5_VENIN|nr:hypothetical protein BLS_006826 [Venturia inaequalis]